MRRDAVAGRSSSGRHALGTATLFTGILLFYLWTVSSDVAPFRFSLTRSPAGRHGMLADAFLHGQLSLRISPSPALLALEDPYDPVANAPYRLHDASLFEGRYYLYFTPLIAAGIVAPFKLLTGLYLPETLLAALLGYVGAVLSYATFRRIATLADIRLSVFESLLAASLLSVATSVPFLLRRVAVYDVCIAGGYALLMASLFRLAPLAMEEQPGSPNRRAAGAGLLLGLAFLARPSLLPASAVLALGVLALRRALFKEQVRRLSSLALSLLIPMIVVASAMAWYNAARFGSPLEFGLSYQLAGFHPHRHLLASVVHVPIGLYLYLLHPPLYDLRFPYFHVTSPSPPLALPSPYLGEPTLGLLTLPVFLLGAVSLAAHRQLRRERSRLVGFGGLLAASAVVSLYVCARMGGVTMRYLVDFAPSLLLVTLLLFFAASPFLFGEGSAPAALGRLIFLGTAIPTLAISLAISLQGYTDGLRRSNPRLFDALSSFDPFSPAIEALHALARPSAHVPTNAPWNRLQHLRVDAIRAPNGVEPAPEGPFFWLGDTAVVIDVFSDAERSIRFAATVAPGPGLPDTPRRTLRIVAPGVDETVRLNESDRSFSVALKVPAGTSSIRLSCADSRTVETLQEGDRRTLLLRVSRLRLLPND